jgi:RNA polymerase sigma-70 factor (ECF subfamily)
VFEKLKPSLAGSRETQPYAELAKDLGMTEGSVKVAVHRFRQQYRELLRREIASTVSTAAEVDDEIRYLFSVLG